MIPVCYGVWDMSQKKPDWARNIHDPGKPILAFTTPRDAQKWAVAHWGYTNWPRLLKDGHAEVRTLCGGRVLTLQS